MKVQIAFNIKIADSFVDDFTYGINLVEKTKYFAITVDCVI